MKNNQFEFSPKLQVGGREKQWLQFPLVCAKINVCLHHKFSDVDLSPGFEKHLLHVFEEQVVKLLGMDDNILNHFQIDAIVRWRNCGRPIFLIGSWTEIRHVTMTLAMSITASMISAVRTMALAIS